MTNDKGLKGGDEVIRSVDDLEFTSAGFAAEVGAESVVGEVENDVKDAVKVATEKGEAWLDEEKEAVYGRIMEDIEEKLDSGMTHADYLKSLIGGFGEVYLPYKRKFEATITPEEEQHIHIRFVTGKSVAEVAGKRITRPIFIVDDATVYKKVATIFSQVPDDDSHGITVTGKFLGTPDWRQVNLVISRKNERTIGHELRHMIDPNFEVRKGYNRILDELFAYYFEYVVQNDGKWNELAGKVAAKTYYDRYSEQAPNKLEFEEWKALVIGVVRKERDLSAKYNHLAVQRMIVKTAGVNEFLELE